MKEHLKIPSSEKIALIYEFNDRSPLFARVAAWELEKNNPDKAIEILEKGIQLYPDYATAYLIYGQASAYKGNIEKAKEMVYKGYEILEDKSILNFYIEEVEEIAEKHIELTESRRVSFLNDNIQDSGEETDSKSNSIETGSNDQLIEDELDALAKNLSKAKVSQVPEDDSLPLQTEDDSYGLNLSGDQIISETLAGIYFAQGNLEEALSIYKKLLDAKPERADFFSQKIKDIEELIEKKQK